MPRKLRKFIRQIFNNHIVINSDLHFSENACSFGIKKGKGDLVAKFDIDTYHQWPSNKKGEAIFVCKALNKPSLLIIIIETKKGEMEDAFDQLATTASILRDTSYQANLGHATSSAIWTKNQWITRQRLNHNNISLGFILSPGGPKNRGLWQSKRKELLTRFHIKLLDRQNTCSSFTLQELYQKASQ